jgi:hypothetical protein
MLKQVIFWCAVFVVAVISAVIIGDMGFHQQGPSAQLILQVSKTASANQEAGKSGQPKTRTPNVGEAESQRDIQVILQ